MTSREWTNRCPACGVLVNCRYIGEVRRYSIHGLGKEACLTSGQQVITTRDGRELSRAEQMLAIAVEMIGQHKVATYDPSKDYLVPYVAEPEPGESYRGRIVL